MLADSLSVYRIVPVIQLDHVENALPLAQSLIRGGLSCAEITFRTDAAAASIAAVSSACPDMFVGAGTILTADQADARLQSKGSGALSAKRLPDSSGGMHAFRGGACAVLRTDAAQVLSR